MFIGCFSSSIGMISFDFLRLLLFLWCLSCQLFFSFSFAIALLFGFWDMSSATALSAAREDGCLEVYIVVITNYDESSSSS